MSGKNFENMPDQFWMNIRYKPPIRKPVKCTCPNCGKEFDQNEKQAKINSACPECLGISHWKKLKKMVLDSHKKHTEEGKYIECRICGYRAKEIPNHVIAHGISPKDYGITKCQESIDRVKGENNPGYQHGGRFSPFSDKFVKYQDPNNVYTKEEVIAKRDQTVKDNPQNQTTKIEYWLAQGLTQEEAEAALSERQTTFSLKKCIERYGEEEGTKVWKARQEKWLATLDAKTDEEKKEINSRKSTKINYKTLWNRDLVAPGRFYIVKCHGYVKVGVTTHSLKKRFVGREYEEILTHKDTIHNCFMIEQLIKTDQDLKQYKIKDSSLNGWTEMFDTDKEVIIQKFDYYKANFEEEFNRRFPRHAS